MPTPQEIIADRSDFTIDAKVEALIVAATARTSTTAFKHTKNNVDNTNLAIALLCLHQLTLQARGNGVAGTDGASGPLTSETEDGVSKSYANPLSGGRPSEAWLNQSIFGQELLQLRRENISGISSYRSTTPCIWGY